MAVRVRGNKIVIDFRCYLPDGSRVRCSESEGDNTQKNMKRVQSKWKAIQYGIKTGTFNYLQHFPNGPKARYFRDSKSDATFSELWERCIATKSIRSGTIGNYQYQYKNHIEPFFGHYIASDITDEDIIMFRKKLESDGLKASTINTYVKPLCQVLLYGFQKKIIPAYACEMVKSLGEVRPGIDPFNFDELRHFLDVLKVKDAAGYDMILFWSRTGLRPGELCALKWENVDYFNKKALIRGNRQYSGEIGAPKTKHSIRDVDLRPAVIDCLKRQEARSILASDFVWLMTSGKPWQHTALREKFKFWMKLCGLKHRPPKQMRHTFATLHIGAGESISWVSHMMGHSDVEITLKRYNRFIPNLTREDGSAFEKVMDSDVQNGNNPVTATRKRL